MDSGFYQQNGTLHAFAHPAVNMLTPLSASMIHILHSNDCERADVHAITDIRMNDCKTLFPSVVGFNFDVPLASYDERAENRIHILDHVENIILFLWFDVSSAVFTRITNQ